MNNKSKLVLSIILKSNNEHIGIVSLNSINWVHRYADLGIVMGSQKNKWNYAIEACSLMIKAGLRGLICLTLKLVIVLLTRNQKV